MNSSNELVFLCKLIGSDFELNQAGGGNISIKTDEVLYIKSSGMMLSEVEENYGITSIEHSKGKQFLSTIEHIAESNYGQELEQITDTHSLRPSMETPLHLLLQKKYIIHCHPLAVLAICSSSTGETELKHNFPDAEWIPYSSPGLKLARYFKQAVDLEKNIYFMQNHGLIIAHDSKIQALELLNNTIEICSKLCTNANSNIVSEILGFIHDEFKIAVSLLQSNDYDLKTNNLQDYRAICPDDVVYMGSSILHINKDYKIELKDYLNDSGKLPNVFRYQNQTFILASNLKKCRLIEEQLRANILARKYFKCDHMLDQSEVNFLSNWEAEKYRSKGK